MGDMREIFDFMKEQYKERKEKRNSKYEPMLLELGAVKKSEGVYKLGDYFCYPTQGFAMHFKSYKKKSLDKFIDLWKEYRK